MSGQTSRPCDATYGFLLGSILIPADSSSLLNDDPSPLRSSQMRIHKTLKKTEAVLFNAVPTTARKPHSCELLACQSDLQELVRDTLLDAY